MAISMVISSRAKFDADMVSTLLGVSPTRIWYRKEGLKVHGLDNIPQMSWIYKEEADSLIELECAIEALLNKFDGRLEALNSLVVEHGWDFSLVCRFMSTDASLEISLSSAVITHMATMGCRLVWSADFSVSTSI